MFTQVVIGPPGSGKSTYCKAMFDFMTEGFGRKVGIINLDPANDQLPYKCDIDILDLISVEEVMEACSLGPNGSLIYCMEYLETNFDWLKEKLAKLRNELGPTQACLLFDFPGQVELYTHHGSVKTILERLSRDCHLKLVTVNLTDSHYCVDEGKFVSVLLCALSTMVHLETPHLNILSKIDLLEHYGPLPFHLEYFTEVLDLKYLVERLSDDPFLKKYKQLSEAICGVVEDYSLVTFHLLNVQDKDSMLAVLNAVDKVTGYCYGKVDEHNLKKLLSQPGSDSARLDFLQRASEHYVKNQ